MIPLQLLFLFAFVLERIAMQPSCSLYLAPSTIAESGRGLFAGSPLLGNSTFLEDPSILLHEAHSYMGGLRYYVQPITDSDHVALHLGAINFMNSAPQGPVGTAWIFDDVSPHAMSLPYSDFYPRATYTRQNIVAGQELLLDYGSQWFADRRLHQNIPESPDSTRLPLPTLQEKGVCLSDVYVSSSTIPAAHLGLFAARDFAVDEVITVSPVLLLRMKNVLVTKKSSSLINYVLTEPNAPVGILPLGDAAMINHAPSTSPENNVYIAWFDWTKQVNNHNQQQQQQSSSSSYTEKCISKDSTLEHLLEQSVHQLLSYPFAALDIAVYAKRTISAGEELFFDYGKVWQEQFLQRCVDPQAQRLVPEYECLHFRHAIEMSQGLFPSHWYNTNEQTTAHSGQVHHDKNDAKKTSSPSKEEKQNNNHSNDSEDDKKGNEKDAGAEKNSIGNRFSSMFSSMFGSKK